MWMAAIGAIASAIPSIIKGFEGASQQQEARKTLSGLTRPKYERPEEINRAATLSKLAYADPTMTGQSAIEDRIDQNMANSIEASREAGNPLSLLPALQAQTQKATQDLGISAANKQDQDRAGYQNMLQLLAQYSDKEFQMNEFAPYLDEYRESRDILSAGKKNSFGATDELSSIGVNMLGAFSNNAATGTTPTISRKGVSSAIGNYNNTNSNYSSGLNSMSRMYSNDPMYYE